MILKQQKRMISLLIVLSVLLGFQILLGYAEENEWNQQMESADTVLLEPPQERGAEAENSDNTSIPSEEGETISDFIRSDMEDEPAAAKKEVAGGESQEEQSGLPMGELPQRTEEFEQNVQPEEAEEELELPPTEPIGQNEAAELAESTVEERSEATLESKEEIDDEGDNTGKPESEDAETNEELCIPEPEIEEFDSLTEYNSAIVHLSEEFGLGNDRLTLEQYSGSTEDPYLTKRVIVVTDAALPGRTGASRILRYRNEYIMQYATEEETEQAYQMLIASGTHEAVLPDLVVEEEPGMDSGFMFSARRPEIESREHYSWGIEATGLDTMLNRIRENGIVPAQVTVAVLDSGVTVENPYLAGRLLVGYNALDASDDVTDEMGHGTHVTGIVADGTDTNVSILPIKVFNAEGRGPISAVKNAILFALEKGASVINLSMSGMDKNRTVTYLENTFQQAIDVGTVICVSAGNQYSDVMDYYPSRSDKVLTVAALEQSGEKLRRAAYSNYGEAIDFALPGSQIYSTLGTGLGYKSGTSMASPHVAAAIAMIKSVSGEMSFWDIKNTLIRFCDNDLIEGRESMEPGAWDEQCGYGCLNLTDFISPFRFDDVTDTKAYYYDPVYWAWDQGLTAGTSRTTFSPSAACTRGQFVTFLWHLSGDPEPTIVNPFTDLAETDYYYKAVLWAKENGITSGTSATSFNPGSPCTRGQVVTFLWRAMGSPELVDLSNPFTDVKPSDYFYNPVLWAKENGTTSGTSATTFGPGMACTRAQAMTFLYKAMNGT